MAGAVEGDLFIGKRAQELRGLLKIKYPIEHGIVQDWDDMEKIWQFIYTDELKTMSEEVGTLYSSLFTDRVFFCSLLCHSYSRLWVYGKVWGWLVGANEGQTHPHVGEFTMGKRSIEYCVPYGPLSCAIYWHVDIMRAALEWSDHPLDYHSAQNTSTPTNTNHVIARLCWVASCPSD